MTIIDTSFMVDFLKGAPDAVGKMKELIGNDRAAITIITCYELLKGASLSSRKEENLAEVTKAISSMEVIDLSLEACAEAAEIYHELKEDGCLIGEFDIIIAAIARANHEALLTRDQHFKSVQELNIVKW